MNTDYTIRTIRESDYEEYKRILLQLENTKDFNEMKFLSILSERSNLIKVVTEKSSKKIVAICTLMIMYRFGDNKGYIDDFVVDEPMRCKGIGSFLLQYLVEYCISENCYCVRLASGESALGFYTKMEFGKASGCLLERKLI